MNEELKIYTFLALNMDKLRVTLFNRENEPNTQIRAHVHSINHHRNNHSHGITLSIRVYRLRGDEGIFIDNPLIQLMLEGSIVYKDHIYTHVYMGSNYSFNDLCLAIVVSIFKQFQNQEIEEEKRIITL